MVESELLHMYLLIETATQMSNVAHEPLVMHFNSWIFQWFGKSSCMSSQCQTTEFMSAKGRIIHKTQLWRRDINSMMHSTYRTMASLYLLVLGESLAKTRITIIYLVLAHGGKEQFKYTMTVFVIYLLFVQYLYEHVCPQCLLQQ